MNLPPDQCFATISVQTTLRRAHSAVINSLNPGINIITAQFQQLLSEEGKYILKRVLV